MVVKCKPCDIHKKYVFVQNAYESATLFKDRNCNEDEDSADRNTIPSTPEMVDSDHGFILADRLVTLKDICEKMRISVGTAHKILHDDLSFF